MSSKNRSKNDWAARVSAKFELAAQRAHFEKENERITHLNPGEKDTVGRIEKRIAEAELSAQLESLERMEQTICEADDQETGGGE